jgi:hypothetical protein
MTDAPPTGHVPARRSVIGAAGAAAAVAVAAPAAPAPAAAGYRPARYRGGAPLLKPAGRLLVGRFSYGLTPALARQVRQRGGPHAWFEWQLAPGDIPDAAADDLVTWWPGLAFEGAASWDRQIREIEFGWEVMHDYQRWVLQRRRASKRQVHEVMAEFWEHHLHVPALGDSAFVYRKRYGDTIRAHALGRFDEMLRAAITEPSMLLYLDQAVSTKAAPNENLARELLELHTVGRGNHTEDDVKNVARVLTGWRVDRGRTWAYDYAPEWHAIGPVQVLDWSHANALPDGRAASYSLLRHLAHHPATAARIARKLAVKFVSDDPPEALVDRLAQAYLDHDTAIKPVLRVLVTSPEFRASEGQKVRDPNEDVVAAFRLLGVKVSRPTSERSAANAVLWQAGSLGALPFGWPRPDGQPQTSRAWSSPARLLGSMRGHWALSGGWWPSEDVRYRSAPSWVPRFPMRFDLLVDHLSRVLLHRPSTAALLQACCEATDIRPGEKITRDHPLMRWKMNRALATILDSPAYYLR